MWHIAARGAAVPSRELIYGCGPAPHGVDADVVILGLFTNMIEALQKIAVADDHPLAAEQIPLALTAGNFVYDDGATQVFAANGATTYVEHGRETSGRWHVDDKGRFCSLWPPSYQACYDLRWIVEDGNIIGLRFTELQGGTHFDGRYR